MRRSPVIQKAEGDSLLWECPGCKMIHQIHVGHGEGPRWTWNGDMNKPTFNPSVLVTYSQQLTPEQWKFIEDGGKIEPVKQICHSFVVDGQMQFLSDCTHDLAGQTVPIPPLED